jgi:hypothetical protein
MIELAKARLNKGGQRATAISKLMTCLRLIRICLIPVHLILAIFGLNCTGRAIRLSLRRRLCALAPVASSNPERLSDENRPASHCMGFYPPALVLGLSNTLRYLHRNDETAKGTKADTAFHI